MRDEDIKYIHELEERVQELEGTVKHAMKAIGSTEAVRVKLINAEQQNKRYRNAIENVLEIENYGVATDYIKTVTNILNKALEDENE